ncbi:MAG: carboxypeptidase-like regulatory domain-containing protein, partial [Candidatus Altiarchaeota archaeon]|nr:carboxypeptidase-like regulatory domain-containing protein [Candidatus Altiarchaeota archaeon]
DRFTKTSYGKYQLDVYKKDAYCLKRETLDISNSLNITSDPASPKVGELFKLKVVTSSGSSATGVKVMMSPGGVEKIVRTDGYTDSFSVSASGTYTFIASGGSFAETIFTLTVSQKPPLTVTASPDPQDVGKVVSINVQSNGAALSGASVSVSKTGGSTQNLPGTTGADGKITFTPSEVGEYTVKASKTGYDDATDTFTTKNAFQVTLPPEDTLKVGNNVKITVKDASGSPVSGVSVTAAGTSISGTTDAAGEFSFTIDHAGRYDISLRKTGFNDQSVSLSTKGTLNAILSKNEVELGGTVTIKVSDSQGNLLSSTIVIRNPDGIARTETASEYTYTTEKVGVHTVIVSKQDYATDNKTFNVKPKELALKATFEGDELRVNATSHGTPVGSIVVKVKLPDGTESSVTTNSAGIAVYSGADQAGNYTLSATSQDYSSTAETAVKSAGLVSGVWVFVIIVLVVLVLLGIAAVVLLQVLNRKGGSGGSLYGPGGRNKLGGL